MDERDVVRLVEDGVLRETETGRVELGSEFREEVEERVAVLEASEEDALDATMETAVSSQAVRALFDAHDRHRIPLFALFDMLGDSLPSSDEESRLQLSVFLFQLMNGYPQDDGTPANFFPVDADLLPIILGAFDRIVVYVWREDCPPCELMQEDLGRIAADREGVALFSIYGPEWKDKLEDQLGVVGAPTTLFVADGKVDSRLHGAHYPEVITEELEKTLSS
ncbi:MULTISPECIES: thioredoxin family protein [Haloferax]|uniref:Thioredoxin n=1 Tax=Haloferax marinum TaxID=2666143 RepID=A0A6A8G7Q1_9EURY|nr:MULTISPECIES: thioredoxin family protein [Haloferax]KAB1197828.1 thioredoxin family protein [Haloferax sp. CBA1150]MRW96887.1 hypothetical protein [Haloferax marinum]